MAQTEKRPAKSDTGLKAILRKLTATEAELDAEELRAEAQASGCTPAWT